MENNGANKAIPIPCKDRKIFYRAWLSFLTPIHHFTPQVIHVAAELLRHRERLSKYVLDEAMLMKLLMGQDIRDEIIKECNITLSTYRVTINKLKKGQFFKDGTINPRLIPNLDGSSKYNLMLMFDIGES